MKKKKQNLKFVRNIIIGILALFVVAFIVNTAPGYKRDKYKNLINLVIGDENVTEKLQKPIYKDNNGAIYISKEDIQELLDKTLYYDENEKMVIATSEVSVASMKIGESKINIKGTTVDTLGELVEKEGTIYIPIKDFKTVYNIEIKFLEDQNVVIIDKLNEGMIKAEAEKKVKIRYKQRSLSKEIGTLNVGDTVSAFYTTSKGWRLIRTEDGIVGYVKANVLTNEYILRQDMPQKPKTGRISAEIKDGTILKIEQNKIIIKDLLRLTDEEITIKNTDTIKQNEKIWANLRIDNANLESYETRTKIIKNIVSIAMRNDISGINIIGIEKTDLNRFIIELAPHLREVGIKINIVTNDRHSEQYEKNYTEIYFKGGKVLKIRAPYTTIDNQITKCIKIEKLLNSLQYTEM